MSYCLKYQLIYFPAGILLLICLTSANLKAQVEHNYLVGPQHSTCDSLQIDLNYPDSAIHSIEKAVFRFDQKFRLSRITGVQGGHFYSCDGISGYLIITIDRSKKLYKDVPRKIWEELIKTSDINLYYRKNIQNQYDIR